MSLITKEARIVWFKSQGLDYPPTTTGATYDGAAVWFDSFTLRELPFIAAAAFLPAPLEILEVTLGPTRIPLVDPYEDAPPVVLPPPAPEETLDPRIDITITKETTDAGFFVTFEVTGSEQIPLEIFVIRRDDNSYDRVASVWDIEGIPDSPQDGLDVYRHFEFTKRFDLDRKRDAEIFIEQLIPMINRLVINLTIPAFEGAESLTFPLVS